MGDQDGEGVKATGSKCKWWSCQWAQSECPVVMKVVVATGGAGRLLAHLSGQGRAMRWCRLPGYHCDIQHHVHVETEYCEC